MQRKLLWVMVLMLWVTACGRREVLVEEPTLDATRLNQTAISLVTLDFAATQTHIPTDTPTPTQTSTPIATIDRTRPPINTPTREETCNLAAAGVPLDITIPDDTKLAPGTPFSKTWRLKNAGACTWTRQYAVTFFSGNSLGAQYTQYIQQPVNPGDIVDLTVDMAAPGAIGLYQSNWMLSDPDGELFGIGPHGDAPFWVRIEVVLMVTDTPHPTPTFTPTPIVYVSGEADLQSGDTLDLDTATLNPTNGLTADLNYALGGSPTHLLTPLNGTLWAIFDDSEPTIATCANANLNDQPIGFNDVPTGTYFCYRTSDELLGWLLIEGFNVGRLSVSFLTWATP
ncbi:MAG: NBR1-Ig-like domain-containing protein [Brevefilum sp.]